MMKKRVLDVGQCSPDHIAIRRVLESLDIEVRQCAHPDEALEILSKNRYDLVLVNRKIDIDYSDGINLIRQMRQRNETESIPVMLISNYPEYQEEAVSAGALYGFGKGELQMAETKKRILDAIGQ